jgi:hypothetical protein
MEALGDEAEYVRDIAAHALHNSYVYWVNLLNHLAPTLPGLQTNMFLTSEIAKANQTAMLLGWVFIIVTGILLALSLLGLWYLVEAGRRRHLPTSLAIEY